MIYSGVDLIRTSGHHADLQRKLGGPEAAVSSAAVAPTDATPQETSQETPQNALLRFARFIKGEAGKKKRAPIGKVAKGSNLPMSYVKQIEMFADDREAPVSILNLYI